LVLGEVLAEGPVLDRPDEPVEPAVGGGLGGEDPDGGPADGLARGAGEGAGAGTTAPPRAPLLVASDRPGLLGVPGLDAPARARVPNGSPRSRLATRNEKRPSSPVRAQTFGGPLSSAGRSQGGGFHLSRYTLAPATGLPSGPRTRPRTVVRWRSFWAGLASP